MTSYLLDLFSELGHAYVAHAQPHLQPRALLVRGRVGVAPYDVHVGVVVGRDVRVVVQDLQAVWGGWLGGRAAQEERQQKRGGAQAVDADLAPHVGKVLRRTTA